MDTGIDISKLSSDIKKMVDRLEQVEGGLKKASNEIFGKASLPLIEEIQRRAPRSDAPHSRYKGGKVIATYQPGNLSKSFRKLKFRRSQAVWIGAKTTRGEAASGPYDGYYAHMVEFGTIHQRAQPFVRPAFEATKGTVSSIAIGLLKIRLKRYNQ